MYSWCVVISLVRIRTRARDGGVPEDGDGRLTGARLRREGMRLMAACGTVREGGYRAFRMSVLLPIACASNPFSVSCTNVPGRVGFGAVVLCWACGFVLTLWGGMHACGAITLLTHMPCCASVRCHQRDQGWMPGFGSISVGETTDAHTCLWRRGAG